MNATNDEALSDQSNVESLIIPRKESLESNSKWIAKGHWIEGKQEQSISLDFKARSSSAGYDGSCHFVLEGDGVGMSGMKFGIGFRDDTREIQFYLSPLIVNGGPPVPIDAKARIVGPGRLLLQGTFEIRDFTVSVNAVFTNDELDVEETQQ